MTRLTLKQWMDIPGNAEKYRQWKEDEVTQAVMEALRWENPAPSLPANAVAGEVALYVHGVTVGADRMLRRMLTADETPEHMPTVSTSYNVRKTLELQGRSKDEVEEIMRKHGNGRSTTSE